MGLKWRQPSWERIAWTDRLDPAESGRVESLADRMATTQNFGEMISLGEGFWTRDRRRSGPYVDELRGQNIPGNSKAIDRTLVHQHVSFET